MGSEMCIRDRHDPESEEGLEASKKLLNLVRSSTDRQVHQPSSHAKPETPLPGLPEEVKRVYTKQHQTTGLDPSYEGPFNIAERPTKSVVKLEVGSYKDGRVRYEFRHLNDIKPAHPKSLAGTVERPKLGRPAAMTSTSSAKAPGSTESEAAFQVQNGGKVNKPAAAPPTHAEDPPNSNQRPIRTTRNPAPSYVDSIEFSGPPPFRGFPVNRTWSASAADLEAINQSIRGV